MKADFAHYRLEAVIADAARKAFGAAIAENPDHKFFAFALTTLSEVQYIECSLNSDRNLAAILSGAGATSAEEKHYYKWAPNDWGDFEFFGQEDRDFFAPVQTLLASIEEHTGDQKLSARREYVFESMIAALRALDREGCFGDAEARHGCIVFADIYDDDASDDLRARSAKAINAGTASPGIIKEFLDAR